MYLEPILLIRSNNKYNRGLINFQELGYKIINSDILEVEELPLEELNSEYVIVITSMNAIFALEKLQISKNNRIFTVGEFSASILSNLGYKNIIFGKNSAKSLLDQIIQKQQINRAQKILYLSGEIITIDISKKLQNENYDAIRQIVYKINSKSLSKEIIFNLKNNIINSIALFSQNGVRVFFNLCKKENIDLSNKKIICFSDNIRNFCQKLSLEHKLSVKEVTSIL